MRTWATRMIHRTGGSPLAVLPTAVVLGSTSCSPQLPQVDPDLAEAIEWYTGVAGRVDDVQARQLLEQAAADDDPISLMWIARVHSTGRMGYEQDQEYARTLAASVVDEIRAAAAAGVTEAVFLMGTAYDEGLGVAEDAGLAFEWYKRAGDRNHVLGLHNTGNAYARGRGVEPDPAAAVEWWTMAAERGDAITQLRLGEAYEAGRGVEADLDAALRWYERSAEAGNEAALAALARITAGR